MKALKLALDWTANTNHSGFYVAQKKGFYKDLGLEVTLLTPDIDNYAVTPAKKVELGEAHMALCPMESIISYRTKSSPFDAVALAAIFREDVSAIAVLAESGIGRPKDLDGKLYASYKARYEDEIVRRMIKNDGGKGDFKIVYPEKLGIWETILGNSSDATWIFTNWEGIRAKNEGVQLNLFKMADYGIPYGYSPVVMASKKHVSEHRNDYKLFLEATKKGFLYAQEHPLDAANFLTPFVSVNDSTINLLESQEFTSPFYGNKDNWGLLNEREVNEFIAWLKNNGLESKPLTYRDLVFEL
ncbi:ABC transporter substrate-binding protein [Maribacter sp. 2210JD10-5]|uniref:ABC transporter substrate-binding protein n=1 Tax=Maribacter sp. 2210JD10-5 TaxID=3386272 RepID=UPI0039BD2210